MNRSASNPTGVLRESASLEVYLLGTVDFDAALHLQQRLADELRDRSDTRGALILCEHPPIVTIGREGAPGDLSLEPGELIARQIPVRWIGRGGGVVVHVPGQLAVYPIVPFERLKLSPVDLRTRLEETIVRTCDDLKLPAFHRPEYAGLWCRTGKLAEIGLSVRSGVSEHGAFLNVAPDLDFVRIAKAPAGERITSLAAERHSGTLMHTVRSAVIRHFAELLGYEQQHLYTGHPSLRRTRIRVPLHA
ncbi:MAG: lipoyl(octanoyl) transferase LipB [Planctomycetaceae bacterium]|nr:lipoyl(octanoyl) transferase LipB [Planctomycetaceae bacterium]